MPVKENDGHTHIFSDKQNAFGLNLAEIKPMKFFWTKTTTLLLFCFARRFGLANSH